MIYLIDLPGFGTGNNFFDINEIYKKTMSISNSFIFVVKNSIIMENENKRMLNDIFESVKEQKRQFSSKFIKSCLFVLNSDDNQKTEEKDIKIAKVEINEILIGIKKEDIKLFFFNAKFYLILIYIMKNYMNILELTKNINPFMNTYIKDNGKNKS